MANGHMCVSTQDRSTYTLIHIATCARARARAYRQRRRVQRPRMRRRPTERSPPRCARGLESGAYREQRRNGGGVPRADVRVEGGRRLERLRAEAATLSRDRDARRRREVLARVERGCGLAHAHTRARASTHAWARTCRMSALATRAYDYRRARQGVCMECIQIPIHRCVSVHGCEELNPHSHTRSAAPYHQPAHTGTSVCMGEAPTCNPRACVAQEPCSSMYISIHIGHMGCERGTRAETTRTRAPKANARAQVHIGCEHGRSKHM
jgi:hypothetical protein